MTKLKLTLERFTNLEDENAFCKTQIIFTSPHLPESIVETDQRHAVGYIENLEQALSAVVRHEKMKLVNAGILPLDYLENDPLENMGAEVMA